MQLISLSFSLSSGVVCAIFTARLVLPDRVSQNSFQNFTIIKTWTSFIYLPLGWSWSHIKSVCLPCAHLVPCSTMVHKKQGSPIWCAHVCMKSVIKFLATQVIGSQEHIQLHQYITYVTMRKLIYLKHHVVYWYTLFYHHHVVSHVDKWFMTCL